MSRNARMNNTTLLVISCVVVALFVFSPLSALAHAQSHGVAIVPTELSDRPNERPFGSGQEAPTPPGIPLATASDPSYDEQLGMTFTQDFYSMAYNVTAVEQTDPSSGTGPAYLLNGLSDEGYWYQVGLTWNWNPGHTPGTGFDFVYEVFNSTGFSVFPTNGKGGLLVFTGQVNQGDTVLLNLYFSATYGVVMHAEDENTGAYASETYSAEGATSFLGNSSSVTNSNGFFTGLMTEWYHPDAYLSNEQEANYSSSFALSSAWMWIDEFECSGTSCSNITDLFSASTSSPVSFADPTQLQEFFTHGATEFSDAYEFITGAVSQVVMTLSYSVRGGGTGYSPPVLTYVTNGVTTNAPLGTTPSTFYVDPGSGWYVDETLGGPPWNERWQTDQNASGTVESSEKIVFVYYHQYLQTLSYSVSDSSAPTAPTFEADQFGSPVDQPLFAWPVYLWFDSGTQWSVTNPMAGAIGERWQINATLQADSGTISSPQTTNFVYYHQFQVTFTVSPAGEGTTSPMGLDQWEVAGPLSISATHNPGYAFTSWNSNTDAIELANPYSAKTKATISGVGTITANFVVKVIVSEQVSIAMSPEGSPPVAVAISGCDANITSIPADSNPHTFAADAQCPLTFTAPAKNESQVWEFSISGTGSRSWRYTTVKMGTDVRTNTLYTMIRLMAGYAVIGGGPGYSAPILSFKALGLPRVYNMTTVSVEIDIDEGSSWNLTNPLLGSASSERWQAASDQVSGVAAPWDYSISAVYFYQALDILSYSVVGGGSPAAPTFTADQFGILVGHNLTASPFGYWFDTGTPWTITNQLSPSNSSQRWQTREISGEIRSTGPATTTDFVYYHQFLVTLSYAVIAGGSPAAPAISGVAFGKVFPGTLSYSLSPLWLDSGSTLNLPAVLLSSSGSERWVINVTLPFAVNSAITRTVGYHHQYYVDVESAETGGGSVSPASLWCNATSTLHLVASSASGWILGAWVGNGAGSYSGKASTTDVLVEGSINETAVFYPGLNLGVESGGSVTYSYGSTLEHTSQGQQVLYVPPGTNVTLIANPSSAFYSFGGWAITHASGMSTIWIVVNAPTTIEATFSYNLVTIGALSGAIVAIIAIVVFYTLRVHGRRNPPQFVR